MKSDVDNGLLMIAFLVGADFFKWLGLPRLAFYSAMAALLTVAEMVIANAVAQGIERANKKKRFSGCGSQRGDTMKKQLTVTFDVKPFDAQCLNYAALLRGETVSDVVSRAVQQYLALDFTSDCISAEAELGLWDTTVPDGATAKQHATACRHREKNIRALSQSA